MALAMLLLTFGTVFTDFPGGSVGGVRWLSESHIQVAVEGQSDQDSRNRQASWYYFRLDGETGKELTIELIDLVGEYNYKPGAHAVNKNTHPVYSYDRDHWTHFPEIQWDEKNTRLRLTFTPEQMPVWIAHTPPYTSVQLDALEKVASSSPHFTSEDVGETVQGRPMPLWTITDTSVPPDGKKTAWLMFRQHAWESGSSWVGDGAIRYLLSDDPAAANLRREVIWKIFPMADPDGVEHGGVRFNRNGYDLNRNWDAVDPAKMPEIAAQHAAIKKWIDSGNKIHLFLTLHNTETGEYLEGPAQHRKFIEDFRNILKKESTFNPTRRRPQDAASSTTVGMKGRMSVNQGLFTDFGIPAMLMEQMIARNQKLGGLPTILHRKQFGKELVLAVGKTLRE